MPIWMMMTANDEHSSYSRHQQRSTLRSWHFWRRCGQCPMLGRYFFSMPETVARGELRPLHDPANDPE